MKVGGEIDRDNANQVRRELLNAAGGPDPFGGYPLPLAAPLAPVAPVPGNVCLAAAR